MFHNYDKVCYQNILFYFIILELFYQILETHKQEKKHFLFILSKCIFPHKNIELGLVKTETSNVKCF